MSKDRNTIKEAIFNHLKMKTNGALMLTGSWGSGKTFFLKNEVFPAIEKEAEFIPIIVSLYGETDKANIAQKVLFAYFDNKGKDSSLSTGTLIKNIKTFTDAIPKVKDYVNVEKLIVGTGDNLFRLIPHQKLLIVFDDLERISKNIEINDFLGLVNDLVENKGSKVLLVANNEKLAPITFREKTIEKSIHFFPEISSVLDNIVDSYTSVLFKEYIVKDKDFILKTLDPATGDAAEQMDLENSFTNIRTLKFVLEHFRRCFALVTKEKLELDELDKKKLRNLWVFILSVSVEYKKPDTISYQDRRQLDNQTSAFANVDINLLTTDFETDIQEKEENNDWKYSEDFVRLYYSRIAQNYIFYPSVYDFITAGKTIPTEEFLALLEEKFNITEGKIDPAHDLLDRFSQKGYWHFTNEEFQDKLKELFIYVKTAELNDLVSYLNAGIFLMNFQKFLRMTEEEIERGLQEGIKKFLNSGNLTDHMKRQFHMVSRQFRKYNFRETVIFIEEEISRGEKEDEKREAERLKKLFEEDLDLFVADLLPEDLEITIPAKPVFRELEQSVSKELINSWQPKSIKEFSFLLDQRYLKNGFHDRLKDEIIFLEALEKEINDLDLNKRILSYQVIKRDLLPVLEESKAILTR